MKSPRPQFHMLLFGFAGLMSLIILVFVLADRRTGRVQSTQAFQSGFGQTIPTNWVTPVPVEEARPDVGPFRNEASPSFVQQSQVPDLLDAAVPGMVGNQQMMAPVDLPITEPPMVNNWGAPGAPFRQPQIPDFHIGQTSPQDLARRMGGRPSLYGDDFAIQAPKPPGWGMVEPDSLSGIPPIATPAEFGLRPGSTPASTPNRRTAATPRLPILTNSSSAPEISIPDPTQIQPTPQPQPSQTRIPIRTNATPLPALSNSPPGERLSTLSNMDFGDGSGPTGIPSGMTIDGGRVRPENLLAPTPLPPTRPRSQNSESRPLANGQSFQIPAPAPTPDRSRAPILPGLVDSSDLDQPVVIGSRSQTAQRPDHVAAAIEALSSAPPASDAPSAPPSPQTIDAESDPLDIQPLTETQLPPQSEAPLPSPVQQTATTPHPDEPEPVILAQVGRRTLTTTQAEIRGDAMLLFDPSAATGSLGGEFTLAQQAATAWARQTALAEEARSRRISVNDREVSATHQQLLENYGRDPIASLITAGLTQEDALQDLRDRALGEKLVRTIFQTRYPERALRELFDSSPSTFALPPRAKVREIVLPRGQSPEAAERSKEQIHSLWERAKSGNGDFAALAAQHSRSASARDGGLVGWFDQTNPAPPEAARALAGLSAGDITEPFLTEEGWKILQVIEVEAAPTGFAASRALVEKTAKAMARDEILKSAWEKHRARAPQHLSSDEEVRLTAFENRPAQPENPPFTAMAGHQQQSPAKSTVSAPAPRPRRADSVAANPPATQTNSSTPPPPPTRGRDDRGIGGLLSRLQGQDGSTVSSIPSNPYGINASATVSGRRATGDSIANVAGTVGQMGAQLLDRTRQTVTPSATDMAFIDMNQGQSDQGRQNPEGSSPERNSVRSQSLTDEELTAALRGGPDPRKTATSPDLVPDLSPPNREATANPRTSAQSAPTSAQNSRNRSARDPNIPAGFFPEEPKSVSERAAETAKKPIEAVHGAVSRTLGFFRRDKSDN